MLSNENVLAWTWPYVTLFYSVEHSKCFPTTGLTHAFRNHFYLCLGAFQHLHTHSRFDGRIGGNLAFCTLPKDTWVCGLSLGSIHWSSSWQTTRSTVWAALSSVQISTRKLATQWEGPLRNFNHSSEADRSSSVVFCCSCQLLLQDSTCCGIDVCKPYRWLCGKSQAADQDLMNYPDQTTWHQQPLT